MANYIFFNTRFNTQLNINVDDNTNSNIVALLSEVDSYSVHNGSINHLLSGHQAKMGNWVVRNADGSIIKRTKKSFNKTNRKQSVDKTPNLKIGAKAAQLERLREALRLNPNNSYVRELLMNEEAKSRSSKKGSDMNSLSDKPVRTLYNGKKATIKRKNELYDTRIDLESPEVIQQRRDEFVQKCRVFGRV